VGPRGEIYASSSSGEEEITQENGTTRPKRLFVPRIKMNAYKMGEGLPLKERKKKAHLFTKGTDPKVKNLLRFLIDDSIGCP